MLALTDGGKMLGARKGLAARVDALGGGMIAVRSAIGGAAGERCILAWGGLARGRLRRCIG
jgi:hypothetical protein